MSSKRCFFATFLQIVCLIVPVSYAGKLAIVIDDIGYRAKNDEAIYQLPKEVAVAIIPSTAQATARAKQAFGQQRDVIIHLPMQPKNKAQPIEREALLVGMNEAEVRKLMAFAQQKVPYAVGLNNHMGSLATTDKALMRHLMTILAEQKLFFLDSKTAGKSVAVATAKEAGVKALVRHIFLDDSDELVDVERQFQRAIEYARKYGTAIVIGHPRKNSIEVLQKGLANLPTDIQLVSMSHLWRGEKVEAVKPLIMQFEIEPALTSKPPFDYVPLLRGVPKD
ncbi:hypothetical protein EV693_10555 [Nicoletella semolina]|uniref:Divergent polysaccharide deacetylase n=2 Tax=Nicoletella semolina TaxID=271160 RepID=A0A4R2N9A5_9PAST|nr:divergent polysaccharide deacetylase family protein [Nicoletella semolina]MDH2925516.1 hypothetical protein [Nicoletella semolina]TCP17591.1 hypothetical protein EV693_10555 [Nicoletella semolina]